MDSGNIKDFSDNRHQPSSPKAIICVHAPHDASFYDELQTHLSLRRREGYIQWLEIPLGHEVEQTMRIHLQRADLILLLISSHFFAHDPCYMAMEAALEEQTKRKVPVVPIIARTCDWKKSAYGHLQALPDNGQPIAEWVHPEQAYEDIREGLARFVPGFSILRTPHNFHPLIRDLPEGYVPRPKVFQEIKSQLLGKREGQTTAITTALRGAGGFGKTTLALALCHDSEVQAAFPDGILWVELGEQPDLLKLLNGKLNSLGAMQANSLVDAQESWRAALQGRICLLVIDDVWREAHMRPFLEGGSQCIRLITTRNDQILPEDTTRILVDAMEQEEAIVVLSRSWPEQIHQQAYRSQIEELVARLDCWPLLLSLAQRMLASYQRTEKEPLQALKRLQLVYEKHGIVPFHLGDPNERQKAAAANLKVSLNHLEELTRYGDASQRYHELAVFPEDTDIPLGIIQAYWRERGGLDDWESDDLCKELYELSLLQTYKQGTIRLHDVFRRYLLQSVGANLPSLHASLLDATQEIFDLARWAHHSSEMQYLWENAISHQEQAERLADTDKLLTDLRFLAGKALYVDVSTLETDLLRAHKREREQAKKQQAAPFKPLQETIRRLNTYLSHWVPSLPVKSEPSRFESLSQTIMHLSHLLRQAQNPADIGGILLSHLSGEPTFAEQLLLLENTLPCPYLTTWHPLPRPLSTLLLRTLNAIYPVKCCTLSPKGHLIASALVDDTLKIWDTATGAELELPTISSPTAINRCAISPDENWIVLGLADGSLKILAIATAEEQKVLSGHAYGVTCCAVSPKGDWIVSGSFDGTLKVWDVVTGVKRLTFNGHTKRINGCAVSPNGRFITSVSEDDTLKVWDAATGRERLSLPGDARCAISSDSRLIASDYNSITVRTVTIWDATTGAERLSIKTPYLVITELAFSPDSRWIVTASIESTKIIVWDVTTGKEYLTISDHTTSITGCAFSPDGSWLLSSSSDGTLKMWDISSKSKHLKGKGDVRGADVCAVSQNGTFMVTATENTLHIWDAAKGTERLALKGHTKQINGCAVSPDGRFIASASEDRTLKVWDVATGANRLTFKGYTPEIHGCAISPDGKFIVSACEDHTLKLWGINLISSPKREESFTFVGHTASVNHCAVSRDMSYLVSASDDYTLKIWDLKTVTERFTLKGHRNKVNSCAIFPYADWIVSASDDCTLKVWNGQTGKELFTLAGHTAPVKDCTVWYNKPRNLIVSASEDHTLKVWNGFTGKELFTLAGHTAPVNGCAVSPDGSFIVSASSDHTLKIWDAQTGSERLTLQGHTDKVNSCAVVSLLFGTRVRIISASEDHTLKVWEPDTGIAEETLLGHTDKVNRCAYAEPFSTAATLVISASCDGTLRLWNLSLGGYGYICPGHTSNINDCAISSDGRWVVSVADDGTLSVWDVGSGTERFKLEGHAEKINRCAVSPDGSFIVTASDDHTLRVWNTRTWTVQFTLTGHTEGVSDCAISPDGRFILSASNDCTLKVWNAATGENRLTLTGHTSFVRSCTFSPDGRWIVSASFFDKTLKVWDAQTGTSVLTFPVDGSLTDCAFLPDGEHLVATSDQGIYFLRLVI